MSERVSMPALGESVTEGTVTRWLKSVGDEVEVDEPLLEVSTDKVDTEIPSPVAGVLQEILADEDDVVEVGGDLAVIGDAASGGDDSDESASGDTSDDDADAESGDEADSDDGDAESKESDADQGSSQDADAAGDGGGSSQESDADQGTSRDADADAAGDGGSSQESDADQGTSQDADADAAGDGGGSSQESGGSGDGETVTMPALGESVTEGTVTRWLKDEGDDVEVDEPLLEVSTDKVDTEIPSPVAGKLTKILASEDDVVEVGGELAVIGGDSGSSDSSDSSDTSAETGDGDKDAESSDGDEESEAVEPDSGDEDLASEQKVHEEAGEESAKKDSAGSGSDSSESDEESAKPSPESSESGTPSSGDTASESASDVSAYVTPLVRKLAAKHDIDLGSIEGTGVGGRIRKQDVLDAAKAAESAASQPSSDTGDSASAPAESGAKAPASSGGSAPASNDEGAKRGTTEKMSRLRKVIATRMVESLQVSAQLTTVVEVDVSKVARLRAKAKADFLEREGVKLSFMPFFALAAVEALKQHPNVNSSIDGDQVVFHAKENLGIAVDTEKGLIVPVIKDAGDLNIAGLARKIAELAERTRTNKIGPDDLGGGTFTLTNTGSRGALFDTPILNQPQVGILGTGSVVRRPVVHTDSDGQETIAIRSMVYLALTYDHRIVDGADAARFLTTMKTRLEEASFEV
ncbi:hypothetical protein BH23ACT6_BH23ACT6_18310 [soil metagenome]